MKKFTFNTGVRPFDHHPPARMAFMKGFEDSGNGVYVIPFYCEGVPDGVTFKFACDDPDFYPEANYIVREIHDSALLSKYAYFK